MLVKQIKVISITKSDHLDKGQNLQVLSLGPYGTIYAKISPGRLFSVFQNCTIDQMLMFSVVLD